MSSNGVRIQDITDTIGHKSTHVTETVYRKVRVLDSHRLGRSWAAEMKARA
jgi:alkylation response protein AidB-like acyl-CoA dehydrogenase